MVEDGHKIKDDIGNESIIGAENSMANECIMFEKQLDDIPGQKERLQEQWDVEEKMWNIKLDDYRPIESEVKMKFEQNEEFWECIEYLERCKFNQVKQQAEGQLKAFDDREAECYNQLKTMYAKIEEMEKE